MPIPDKGPGGPDATTTAPTPSGLLAAHPGVAMAFLTAVAGFAVALLVVPGTTLLRIYTWDSFAFVDAGYRMASGQVPHIDFHTPLGFLCSALPYWGFILSGTPAGALPMALALALLMLTPILLYVCATRLHWFVAIPTGAFLLMLSAGPLNVGEDPGLVSMGMYYNRLGWTAIVLLALAGMDPLKKPGRPGVVVDGFVYGLLFTFVLYLKITYAVVAAFWLILLFVLYRQRRVSVIIGFAVVVAAAVVIEYLYGLHFGYIQNLMSAGSQDNFSRIFFSVISSSQEITLTVLAVGLLAQQRLLCAKDVILVLFILASGIFILSQNALQQGLTTTVFVLALCAERLARSSPEWGPRSASLYAAVALLLIFVVAPTADHAGALARHALAGFRSPSLAVEIPQELTGFVVQDRGFSRALASAQAETIRSQAEAGNFEGLRHYVPPVQQLFQSEYIFAVGEGLEALKRLAPAGKSVVVLDFANPFSFALQLPPPRGDAFINHVDRLLSRGRPIAADDYLSSATFVMIPHVPVEAATVQYLLDIYGPYLERDFRPADRTQYWTVLRRVDEENPL